MATAARWDPMSEGVPLTPVEAALLATIREQCPEAEAAMRQHVDGALRELLPALQGRTMTEADVDDMLLSLGAEVVAWQLAHSEPWGEAEPARRLSVEVLARAVIGEIRGRVGRVLLAVPKN
jgi:hypothetical protein